ncbi:hypothetical protein MJO29_009314 [Puccinia striiformis f. sp. tritici]|uniref:C3H1-type domain-containing protein n=3 Tax=Puccinia striiformis TaxID=27350 RepID=A0A2S4W624_9BASI|nr:hypothetical protein Pst134EB_018514 [Puccinia striiformis f. sp. tritici]KAI7950640.1 hypothetical protein MJO29_009314 [Puccinia striiformis f. sp. tritici]KAI9614584.1 hypothetical protein KEM48_005895 [Puccinia striiformis f. sp. tritici PST-130]POW17225.1 hypothetical protein PSTT_00561 [Puccinia striiformis]
MITDRMKFEVDHVLKSLLILLSPITDSKHGGTYRAVEDIRLLRYAPSEVPFFYSLVSVLFPEKTPEELYCTVLLDQRILVRNGQQETQKPEKQKHRLSRTRMSAEHQSMRAKIAILEGTINEQKKNLQESNNSSSSSSSRTTTTTTTTTQQPGSSYFRLNSALPSLVTKTKWQANHHTANTTTTYNHNQHHHQHQQQPGRSTKLVFNRATPQSSTTQTTLKPINLTSLSVSAAPFRPSTAPPSVPPSVPTTLSLTTNSRSSLPAQQAQQTSSLSGPLAKPAPNPSTSPVAQTTSNLSNMRIATNTSSAPPATSAAAQSNDVTLGGVEFLTENRGRKLVRKTAPPPIQTAKAPIPLTNTTTTTATSTSTSLNNTQKATPITALIGEMSYARTKSNNLAEAAALKKFQSQKLKFQEIKRAKMIATMNLMRNKYNSTTSNTSNLRSYSNPAWDPKKLVNQQPRHSKLTNKVSRPPLIKKNEQCRFFAKTGACRNGLTCVYQHDPSQVAICSRFLRKKCSYSANSCPLSHVPNPHNMEHCSHFPRCNKSECPYPHVKPTTSQICQDFADLGWCSKGAQCTERHVRECPEFSSKGTCSNPGCRLRHMINRNKNENEDSHDDHHTADEAGSSDEEAKESGGLFFTDLTGTDQKGKRKQQQSGVQTEPESSSAQRTFKGISHNTEVNPVVKRVKYDQMADNSDFVMFISSDEEGGKGPGPNQNDDESDDDDDDADINESASSVSMEEEDESASVDSEEHDSVSMDQQQQQQHQQEELQHKQQQIREDQAPKEQEEEDEIQDIRPLRTPSLPTPLHPLPARPPPPSLLHRASPILTLPYPLPISLPQRPVKLRNRSSLEPGEEIEEGEIFDDDEIIIPASSTASTSFVPYNSHHHHLPLVPATHLDYDDSSDEDEIVARQLLGNYYHSNLNHYRQS